MRVKDLDNWLEYPPLPHNDSKQIVPDYYIRHFDKVNDELQNTVENNWSFKKKNYEINEHKVQELVTHNIKISPSDYEWVIDHFEKTAINDGQQSAPVLIEKLRERGPQHLKTLGADILNQIWKMWKDQREYRCNRSFIRMFWWYQDKVGPDNWQTFKLGESKNKPNMRENVKHKILKYKGAYQERQISVKLCDQLIAHSNRINLILDVKHLEDLEFDKLIGKVSPIVEDNKDRSELRPITEQDLNQRGVGSQVWPVVSQHDIDFLKQDNSKISHHPMSVKMIVKRERPVHEIFHPKPVPLPPPAPVDRFERPNRVRPGKTD